MPLPLLFLWNPSSSAGDRRRVQSFKPLKRKPSAQSCNCLFTSNPSKQIASQIKHFHKVSTKLSWSLLNVYLGSVPGVADQPRATPLSNLWRRISGISLIFFLGAREVILARQTLVPLLVIARVALRLLDQAQSWAEARQLRPPRPTWLSEGSFPSWLHKTDTTTEQSK